MNKETIYIEPGDDITDILARLKSSEKKVIALVPPKKPGVLLSSVNIKLIARTAKSEKKAVVLVTTDDSLTKLAMHANLPVAPSLKSRPVMPGHEAELENPEKDPGEEEPEEPSEPEEDSEDAEEEKAETEEAEENEKETSESAEEFTEEPEASKLVDEIEADEETEESDKPEKSKKPEKKSKKEEKKKSKKESGSPFIAWINGHKKWIIFGTLAVTALVVFFVWALMIAPRVKVSVSVRTSSGNFSENVTFTTAPADENTESGIFYAHEEKLEKDQTIKFTATGQKDLGEKASGTLVVYFQDRDRFSFDFAAGSTFVYKGLEYIAVSDATLAWDGEDETNCGDGSSISRGCIISETISVKAVSPGEQYNVSGQQSGWSSKEFPSVSVYNKSDLVGGTSQIVTIVLQSDIDLALDKLASETKDGGKTELLGKLSDSVLPIEASFKSEATAPSSTPAVGEEVPEGVTPSVSSKTTYTILTVDMVRIEEFIKFRTELEENRQMYSIGSPFVEYFTESDNKTYSAKLKTTYKTGPKISETEILDKISGQKIGRIEPVLKDAFPGIASVSIEKSYFWVNAVPSNPNQVEINVEIEE